MIGSVRSHASAILGRITRPVLLKRLVWVGIFWVIVVLSILLNIEFLRTTYPNPPRPHDLLLDVIPEMKAFITVGEVLSMVQVSLVVFLLMRQHFVGGPYLLFVLGVMYMMRGFTITLTPLAQIQPPIENYAETHIIAQEFYHGMFFSGHTASAFIQALFFKGHRLRPVLFTLASVQAFSLIASHSHYTIDVFGAIFVAYFVTHFDFMRLVPERLRGVKWLPWYGDDAITRHTLNRYPPPSGSIYETQEHRAASETTASNGNSQAETVKKRGEPVP